MSKLSSSYFAHLELGANKQVAALIRSLVSLRFCFEREGEAHLELELTHSGADTAAQWGLAVRLMAFALGLIATLKWFALLWFCFGFGFAFVEAIYFYVS